MIKYIKKIEYDLYLVLLGVLAFLSYTGFMTDFLLPIYLIIGIYLIIKKANVLYLLPLAMFLIVGAVGLRDHVRVTTILTISFVVLIVIDFIRNRKFTKLGKLFLPLSVLTALSIITIFNAPDTFSWFAGLVQMLSALGLYFYFVNTIDGDPDNFKKISKILMYLGMFVTFEMIHYLIGTETEILTIIRLRQINLGWENLNVIIFTNIMAIPFIGYLITQSKVKLPYMIFALINIVGILLTLSRSSILTLGVMVVIAAPIIFFKEKNKKNLIIQGIGFLFIVIICGLILEKFGVITGYFDSLFGRDLLHFEDRRVLLEVAWDVFKKYPLFGGGGLYTSRVYLKVYGSLNYHNTIAQVSTLGISGLIAFAYLFVEKTKVILRGKSEVKWFLLIMIYATAFINGSLQPMYFYTTYLVVIFMMMAAYENIEEPLN